MTYKLDFKTKTTLKILCKKKNGNIFQTIITLVLSPGLVLVQKVVDSGEGAGTRANPGHQLHALGGLTQSQHERRLFGQILRL